MSIYCQDLLSSIHLLVRVALEVSLKSLEEKGWTPTLNLPTPTSSTIQLFFAMVLKVLHWAVLSDEQTKNEETFSFLRNEQMSNEVGVVRTNQYNSCLVNLTPLTYPASDKGFVNKALLRETNA